MATVVIQKRKGVRCVSYAVRYKDPATHKTRYYNTYRKLKDAHQAANELRALIDLGKMSEIQKNRTKLNLLTFSEVSQVLHEQWKDKLERNELKQKTVDEYIVRSNVLNKTFGKRLLHEITTEDVLEYQSAVASSSSVVTSNRSLFVIKQVFKVGIEIRAISEDRACQVKYLSEKEHERNEFLLPAELVKLLEASQQTKAKYYMPALICLGAEHGAAKQEALSLEWSDIDFDYKEQGIIRLFRSKNRKERTEYLMPRTRRTLLEWRKHQQRARRRQKIETVKSNLVFCRHDGTPLKRFDKAWRSTRSIAGFNGFHFHDLRHTFCSNLLMSGADLKDVKEMIGHSDLAMTDRYSHLTLKHKLARQEKLAEHYANSL